jgi:hypothetical protein
MSSAADAFGKAHRRKTLQAPIVQESRVHGRHRRHVTRRVVHVVAGSTVRVRHPSELALEVIGLLEHRAVDSDLRTRSGKGSHTVAGRLLAEDDRVPFVLAACTSVPPAVGPPWGSSSET